MTPLLVPIALVSTFALWRLRVSDRLTIRIGMAIVGADGFTIALTAGVGRGAPILGVLIVSFFFMIVAAAGIGAYLLAWRRRGGKINGHPMPW